MNNKMQIYPENTDSNLTLQKVNLLLFSTTKKTKTKAI